MKQSKEQQHPVICSWCGATYAHKDIEGSHGICPRCAVALMDELPKSPNGSRIILDDDGCPD